MYRIALCDDEKAELIRSENLLLAYEKQHSGLEFSIQQFESTDDLFQQISEENDMPDLIFMDILMPNKQNKSQPIGIQAAKKLRNLGYIGKLVFLTSSKEYALDAYEVDAIQYMVKPISSTKFFDVLNTMLKDIEDEQKKCIIIRIEGSLVKISINDIVYCEAQKKNQCLYLTNGNQYIIRMTMGDIYKMLSQYPEFVRIGVAFIVNLEYVDKINANEIVMDNGIKIYLPRGSYKDLKEQYLSYYCQEKGDRS